MTPAARIAAAIEIFDDVAARRRPVGDALKDWGLSHRFAGAKDRAAIATLVYDGLRVKASSAWRMGAGTGRAVMLGMLAGARGEAPAAIEALFDGSRYGPAALTDEERRRLSAAPAEAPPHVAGDYPEWLDAAFAAVFGEARAAEGRALAARAPLDLRVNRLKAEPDAVAAALRASLGVEARRLDLAPDALRLALRGDGQPPRIDTDPAYLTGLVEIQDAGSQIAARLADARPGEKVLDYCAGGGGKTLAIAAMLAGEGGIYAFDRDRRRLAPIHERLARAGVANAEVRTPLATGDALADLEGRMDLVLVDAPCTGTGTWRRNPDAKWRLRPAALELRLGQQVAVLDRAADFVHPGGRLVYVTCSVLDAENGAQIRAFLARRDGFALESPETLIGTLGAGAARFRERARLTPEGVLMTPHRTDTDGFFVAMLRRRR